MCFLCFPSFPLPSNHTHGPLTTPYLFIFTPSLPSSLLFLLYTPSFLTLTPAASTSTPTSTSETEPVASLASRISGLTTSSTTPTSSEDPPPLAPPVKGSETRPKFNAGGNNLFGRALAGAKSDRPAATKTEVVDPTKEKESTPTTKTTSTEKKKGEMTNVNLMDADDGQPPISVDVPS